MNIFTKGKKKVGIITFHASHNCGSMLQSFALQTVLSRLGCNPSIIDYSNIGQRDLYSVRYKNNTLKNFLKNVILLPHIRLVRRSFSDYETFKRTHFHLTKKSYSNLKELNESDLGFDEYVCGSDQIWNITIEDSDDAYFLPFVCNHKKIAYAPSFGAKDLSKYAGERISWYREKIMDFDSLSIREKNGQKWIKMLTGLDVPVVLDPTLLIDCEEYKSLERKVKIPEHFIFYYAPGYMKDLNRFVGKISKRYSLPVFVFNTKQFYIKRLWKYGFNLPEREDPGVYLFLMRKADMVFTTSFHGTIFASLFHKKFWTLKNTGMFGDDDRVRTLVNQLGLEKRLIVPSEMPKDFDYFQGFDFNKYNVELGKRKTTSIGYLTKALSLGKGKNNG